MKELKDYLPYYLGCEVQYLMNGKGILSEISLDSKYGVLVSVKLNGSNKHRQTVLSNIKLILRPLSSLSNDEAANIGILPKKEWHEQTQEEQIKWLVNNKDNAIYSPKDFLYLLSNSFDLFGLIEAGLAIYKTTLK